MIPGFRVGSTGRLLGMAAAVCILCGVSAVPAQAEAVAMIEDISQPRAGLQPMDYLAAGQMIPLAANETLVVDYLQSCVRETIVGGVVSIGAQKSVVVGGKISSETVECDGGKPQLTAEQSAKSGVMVFRSAGFKPHLKSEPASGTTVEARTIYGTSPIFDLASGGKLVVERVDQPGEKHVADVAGSSRTVYDSAKAGWSLKPGGLYRAKAGSRELVFKVADTAKPGAAPPVGRLLRL